MKRGFSFFQYPLDLIFSAPSHIAILRVLKDNKEGMSGRSVAKEASVNHQACAVAIRRLETVKIVDRLGSGKTQLVRLNLDHFLVRELLLPLLRQERELSFKMRQEIIDALKLVAKTATIFGSVARGNAILGSDVDLFVVADSDKKNKTMEILRNLSFQFAKEYGLRLSPLTLTPKEVCSRIGHRDPLLINILKEGIDLLPHQLKKVIS